MARRVELAFGLGVIRRQGAVLLGDPLAAGGQRFLQRRGVHARVLLHDPIPKPGLDHEVHLVQQVDGQAVPVDHRLMERRVGGGAIDDRLVRLARQDRALVAEQNAQRLIIATRDDRVGNQAGNAAALGDRPQVILTLGAGHVQQVVVGQGAGVAQNGRGHGDRVGRQSARQAVRWGLRLAQALGQLHLDRFFHVAGQLAENLVEEVHLHAVVPFALEEQVRHAA